MSCGDSRSKEKTFDSASSPKPVNFPKSLNSRKLPKLACLPGRCHLYGDLRHSSRWMLRRNQTRLEKIDGMSGDAATGPRQRLF
jgi:hypothetical protein